MSFSPNNIFSNIFPKSGFSSSSSASKSGSGYPINSVAITGATGLLGTELVKSLESKNIKVYRITARKPTKETDIYWNPSTKMIENSSILESVDAVINLAGENVASGGPDLLTSLTGRWTNEKMKKVMDSRVDGTKLLVDTFKQLKRKPKIFLSASAVGYYGYTDSTNLLDESSPKGTGFLSEVSQNWEKEALQADALGISSSCMRFGVILSPKGGVVGKLLPLFTLFLGGIIGSGKQGIYLQS